jgi:hypothetical protein
LWQNSERQGGEQLEKTDILSLSLSELEALLVAQGEKKFRAKQIFQWLHIKRVFDFDEMITNDIEIPAISNRQYVQQGIFNLQGQRVNNPNKGIYIVNGKKQIFR